VKFITGEGGVGKSRLAAEFATSLKKKKWQAGFVDLRKSQQFPLKKEGTLLVIDYPEENRDGVEELLRDLTGSGKNGRLRVMFLTRQTIDNWMEFIHDSHASDIVDMVPIDLGRLEGPAAHKLFSTALECAAETFQTTPPPLSEEALIDWLGRAPENERALFILAAAVHSAIHPDDEVVRYTGREVVETLANREIYRLRCIASDRNIKDKYCFVRVQAMAAIANMIPVERIMKLTQDRSLKLGFPADIDIETELKDAGLLSVRAILAPKPDIIAAAFTVIVLARKPEMAPDLIWVSLKEDIEGGLERIARLCHDAEIVLQIHEHRLSRWLAKAVEERPDRCAQLDPFFIEPPLPLGWLDTGVAVCRTLRDVTDEDDEKTRLLNNLSYYLDAVGDAKGALKAIQESVEIYRRLAKANPARFEPDLAMSLNNLSNRLDAVGDAKGALGAIQESVEIRRRLAKANPARFEPDLAMSLNNLSNRLYAVGDTKGALGAIQESVEIYRRLAKANPARFEPDLAMSLVTLGTALRIRARYSEAAEAFREGVDLIHPFAKQWPKSPHARLLSNLESGLQSVQDEME